VSAITPFWPEEVPSGSNLALEGEGNHSQENTSIPLSRENLQSVKKDLSYWVGKEEKIDLTASVWKGALYHNPPPREKKRGKKRKGSA